MSLNVFQILIIPSSGPNDLAFNNPEAIDAIYRTGKKMPKSEYYDGFVSVKPDIFSSRDENVRENQFSETLPSLTSSLNSSTPFVSDNLALGFLRHH